MHGLTAYFLQYENNLGNAQKDQDLKQNNQGMVNISINLSFTTKTSILFCRRDVMKQKLLFQHVVGYMQPQSSRGHRVLGKGSEDQWELVRTKPFINLILYLDRNQLAPANASWFRCAYHTSGFYPWNCMLTQPLLLGTVSG